MSVTLQSRDNATFVYGISSVVTTNLEKKNPEIDSWTNAITHYTEGALAGVQGCGGAGGHCTPEF